MTSFDVQPGDIYGLGDSHRLMCGDATSKEDVKRLFDGRKPTLVVTSPPYAKQRDYDRPIACWDSMMLGALDGHDFADDVQMLINLGVIHKNNEWIDYWHSWIQEMRHRKWRQYSVYIWDKKMSFPGNFHGRLRPSHEQIFHLNKATVQANAFIANKWFGNLSKIGPIASGIKKRNGRSLKEARPVTREYSEPLSVISQTGVKSTKEATGHPAQMPIVLAAFLIRSWKKKSCLTYDPFSGSGTTTHAAELEGVSGLGMEISPAYTAIALARWAKAYPNQQISKIN